MVDIKKIRENPDFFKKATADKQRDPNLVDEILKQDEAERALLQKVEILRAERNKLGKENIERGKEIKKELEELENNLKMADAGLISALWRLPNPALPKVPVGKDDNENTEIKKVGEVTKFEFPVKSQVELGELLDLIDTQRAGKVSGTRFGYLKNEAVLLELALVNLGMKFLIEKGFTPILPPALIQKEVMAALGYNNYGFEETYILPEDDLCLIATAEHAIVPYFKDEVLQEGDLPKRFVGFSSAFRREAGSYGKDTKGILRVHQFDKLEMVSFVKPEDSEKEHEFLLSLEEELMQKLKLPYRVLQICTGDLGDPAANKYDVETWFPSENKYRETHSTSNCTDYQSRRLKIRFKRKTGETEFVHILNGTVFSQRPILAILENYQQKDGSVIIPEVLRDYIGKDKISPKS
ncbi:serine--tRNA ligase [Candidatus Shapirobacteria bacterium CG03_land_8_20_14_0_80_39_12]|uniref:Serine--tRNA ligase n=1 Tax=Candidatus Shapirobacteria bacterium CG03_land_8_20_14_0_80_39_12 TaxID=1974879 RepID=A0A2M7BCU8_9BACT|nr:MAG: serine--tRNA ligase [Candidatus Shapirobacteria bacterium CG03_land_8_20_14_0_80_39_12]